MRLLNEGRLRKEVVPALVKRFPVRSRLRPRSIKMLLHTAREKGVLFEEVREGIASGAYDFYFADPIYGVELLLPKSDMPKEALVREILSGLRGTRELLGKLSAYTEWNEGRIQEQVWEYAEKKGKSLVLWPLRVALSGRDKSPGPFTIAQAIGKRQTLRRIQKACDIAEGILSAP